LSRRIHVAIFFSLFLHLIFISFISQDKKSAYLSNDLFSNKITLNFSNLSEKLLPKNKAKEVVSKKDKTEDLDSLQKSKLIFTKTISKHEEIPSVNNFNVVGTKIMPNYPRRALKLHQEGVIYLKILVSDKGLPEKIIFTQKSKYNLLNKAALDAVSKWKFQPMITNGHKSKMWVNVPIEFKIS
jgi:protein TonB